MSDEIVVPPESVEYVDFCWRASYRFEKGERICDCPLYGCCPFNPNSWNRFWKRRYVKHNRGDAHESGSGKLFTI